MASLTQVKISSFRSIRSQTLDLRALNVFIGSNGAGKSNFVQVFRFLREIVSGNLAEYTAKRGGAGSVLHFGGRRNKQAGSSARELALDLVFKKGSYTNGYSIRLIGTDDDSFVFKVEESSFHDTSRYGVPYFEGIANSGRESGLRESPARVARYVFRDLDAYRIFHFHDTSETAAVKAPCAVDDNRSLREDGGNLAAFLYFLQERHAPQFQAITDAVRQVAPFFGKFQLAPLRLSPDKIKLEWTEKGDDAYFNASALSDGTLRFMCLATLLLQPELPPLVLLDEPELGLHPAAIVLLASMLEAASTKTQLIVATQSTVLIDQLKPEHVWTVDRVDGASVFRWLGAEDLSAWLDNYSLGELWQKNVFGARP